MTAGISIASRLQSLTLGDQLDSPQRWIGAARGGREHGSETAPYPIACARRRFYDESVTANLYGAQRGEPGFVDGVGESRAQMFLDSGPGFLEIAVSLQVRPYPPKHAGMVSDERFNSPR